MRRISTYGFSVLFLAALLFSVPTLVGAAPPLGSVDPLELTEREGLIEDSYIISFKDEVPSERGRDSRLIHRPDINKRGQSLGDPSTPSSGQSKAALANDMGLNGEVLNILDGINAVHVHMGKAEAERWRNDPRVKAVEQDASIAGPITTQTNPGWGLDRMDEPTASLDNTYNYIHTGAGRTVYILDTGLNLGNPAIAAEFGGRASLFWDAGGGNLEDCFGTNGHGTPVASIVGGETYGMAKGVTLIIAKIYTDDGSANCESSSEVSVSTLAIVFNWLAVNAPAGTIANLSTAFHRNGNCQGTGFYVALDSGLLAAHDAGIIMVIGAGNDGCNTKDWDMVHLDEPFVVGATDNSRINSGQDAKASFSRTGWEIDAFAPGNQVAVMSKDGLPKLLNGTSFSAPYIAGLFAVACSASGTFCDTISNATEASDALKAVGTLDTVTEPNGSPLVGATSRFIHNPGW